MKIKKEIYKASFKEMIIYTTIFLFSINGFLLIINQIYGDSINIEFLKNFGILMIGTPVILGFILPMTNRKSCLIVTETDFEQVKNIADSFLIKNGYEKINSTESYSLYQIKNRFKRRFNSDNKLELIILENTIKFNGRRILISGLETKIKFNNLTQKN